MRLQIDSDESRIDIKAGNYKGGKDKVYGEMAIGGGNCPGSSCDISLEWAVFWVGDFSLKYKWDVACPIKIRDLFGSLLTGGAGTVKPNGAYRIPADQLSGRLYTHAFKCGVKKFNKTGIIDVTGKQDSRGSLDFQNRRFVFDATFTESNMEAKIHLEATWDNLPPVVRASAESTIVECDAPGTGTVRLFGEASDFGGSVVHTQWVIDGKLVSTELDTEQHLSLGDHVVVLRALDNEGAWANDMIFVSVVDTTPPVLGPGADAMYCAWPPNHKYIKLTVEDQILASDVCDPNPTVVFLDGWSTEPDNDTGDGDTTNDILVYDDAVCLRSERSGTGDGRRYAVSVGVQDSSGNSSGTTFDVLVSHDQRGHECRALPHSTFISHADAPLECPVVEEETTTPDSPSGGRGCATIGARPLNPLTLLSFLLVAFFLLFRRRRS